MDAAAQDKVRGTATTPPPRVEVTAHTAWGCQILKPVASRVDSESRGLDREALGSRSRPITDKLGFAGTFQA